MRAATAAQRLKPGDEKRKQVLAPTAFDVGAGVAAAFFHGSPGFSAALWQETGNTHVSEEPG